MNMSKQQWVKRDKQIKEYLKALDKDGDVVWLVNQLKELGYKFGEV